MAVVASAALLDANPWKLENALSQETNRTALFPQLMYGLRPA
jgi:hypothetical protein